MDGSPGCRTVFEGSGFLDSDRFVSGLPDSNGEVTSVYQIPCGKCINCRRNQSFAWSLRVQMEQQLYKPDECCFVTLTYVPELQPYSLEYSHFQIFMRSLRSKLRPFGVTLRFFVSGEYGDISGNAHFHAILFGYDFFRSARKVGVSKSGEPLFVHSFLTDAWSRGIINFGALTPRSASYVSQYAQKKLIFSVSSDRRPPFVQMSRNPGLGHDFIIEHSSEIVRDGGVWLNGKFVRFNRYMQRVLLPSEFNSERPIRSYEFDVLLAQARSKRLSEANREICLNNWHSQHDGDYLSYVRELADIFLRERVNRSKVGSCGV